MLCSPFRVSTLYCEHNDLYMEAIETGEMTQQRALLTETERQILNGEEEVKDNYRYSVESRVRTRIANRLPDDVEVIKDNHPDMYETLVQIVCEGEEDG